MLNGFLKSIAVLAATLSAGGCLSPTDPSAIVVYDDAIDITGSPDPIAAEAATDGRTYRIVRGNNQPDEILPHDWHTVFSATMEFNEHAQDDDLDLTFPVRITAATLTVRQAVGGIVTPPTGGETEHFEFVTLAATGNSFPGIDSPVTLTFEVWYDLPSLRKEAIITVTGTFVDDEGRTFTKSEDLVVGP